MNFATEISTKCKRNVEEQTQNNTCFSSMNYIYLLSVKENRLFFPEKQQVTTHTGLLNCCPSI